MSIHKAKPLLSILALAILLACEVVFGGETTEADFRVLAESGQEMAWTNDGNPRNGWLWEDSTVIQKEPNEDSAAWGDRYLVFPNSLQPIEEGGSLLIDVDMMALDYAGDSAMWQGLSLFVDRNDPMDPGRISVIYERADGLGYSGLRIHADNEISRLFQIAPQNLEWRRLRVALFRDESGEYSIRAIMYSPDAEGTDDWQLDMKLPPSTRTDRPHLALATSAQYGYGVNPRVAFSAPVLQGSVDSIAPPPASDSWPITYQLEFASEYIRSWFRIMNRDQQFDSRVANLVRDIRGIDQPTRAATFPLVGYENQYLLERLIEHSNLLEKVDSVPRGALREDTGELELLIALHRLFQSQEFEAVIRLGLPHLEKSFSGRWEGWEVRRRLLHALSKSPEHESDYLSLLNEALGEAPDFYFDDFAYNHAVWLEGQGENASAREFMETLLLRRPSILPSVWDSLLNMHVSEQGYADLEVFLSGTFAEHSDQDPRVAAIGNFYRGLARIDESDLEAALGYFRQVSECSSVRVEEMPTVLAGALIWEAWILNNLGDFEASEAVASRVRRLPIDEMEKAKMLGTVLHQRNLLSGYYERTQ